MQIKQLFVLITLVIVCYLTVQAVLFVWTTQVKQAGLQNHRKDGGGKTAGPKNAKGGNASNAFWNLKDYLDLAHTAAIPIMLLDPTVLQNIISPPATSQRECRFFCDGRLLTVIGTHNHMWTHDEAFLTKVTAAGFSVYQATETDKEMLLYLSSKDNNATVHTHYLFHRGQHTIHQVVLFTQKPGYLLHGKFHLASDMPSSVSVSREFGNYPGAYESFAVHKVTLDGLRVRAPKSPAEFLRDGPSARFVACNRSRAELFYSTYGRPEEGDPAHPDSVSAFREANRDILHKAKRVLDSLGVPFWLSSGTCLGWYRQCDPIHYSGDVDIGVWIKDLHPNIIQAMHENDLNIMHIFGKESDSYELSFENGEVKLDIFFFYEESDHMWNGGTRARTGHKYKYIFPKFSLCWTEFLGLKVRVPCETEQYLEANYGKRWFEPVTEWDWKKSPTNVVENGRWPETEWDRVIQVFS